MGPKVERIWEINITPNTCENKPILKIKRQIVLDSLPSMNDFLDKFCYFIHKKYLGKFWRKVFLM
jgi:hypothetical protein